MVEGCMWKYTTTSTGKEAYTQGPPTPPTTPEVSTSTLNTGSGSMGRDDTCNIIIINTG